LKPTAERNAPWFFEVEILGLLVVFAKGGAGEGTGLWQISHQDVHQDASDII